MAGDIQSDLCVTTDANVACKPDSPHIAAKLEEAVGKSSHMYQGFIPEHLWNEDDITPAFTCPTKTNTLFV